MTRLILALAVLLALPGAAVADAFSDFDAAREAFARGNYDSAIDYYTRAIQSGELSTEHQAITFYNRGRAYADKGDYERAIDDYKQAIRFEPDYAKAFNSRGIAFWQKGEYDRAIADYDRAIRLKPDFAAAFYNRGNAYSDKGQYDPAIADFTQAIRLKPDNADAFNNRGEAYRKKGEYDRAIADYDRAIGLGSLLDHDLAFVLTNRGLAYRKKGEYDRAITDYDRAIELDPDYALAFNNKAWLLATASNAQARDGREAVRLAQEAVRLGDDPGYRDTLAAAFAEAGRFGDAVAEQERAIEMLRAAGKHDKLADLQSRLDLYRQHRPYRE